MGRTLEEMIAAETPEIRAKIETRYGELVEEAETLAAVRKVAARTQEEVAKRLKIKQPSVARLERQSDMFISTLRGYIEAAGGKLHLMVKFPARAPLMLTGLGDIAPSKKADAESPMVVGHSQPARRRDGKTTRKKDTAA